MNEHHVGDDLVVDGVHMTDKEQGRRAIPGSEWGWYIQKGCMEHT